MHRLLVPHNSWCSWEIIRATMYMAPHSSKGVFCVAQVRDCHSAAWRRIYHRLTFFWIHFFLFLFFFSSGTCTVLSSIPHFFMYLVWYLSILLCMYHIYLPCDMSFEMIFYWCLLQLRRGTGVEYPQNMPRMLRERWCPQLLEPLVQRDRTRDHSALTRNSQTPP